MSISVFVEVGEDITKCETPSIEGASRKNEWKKLQLLHQVINLAGPAISESDCKNVLTLARTSRNRHTHYEQVAVVVLDDNARTDLIAGDRRSTVESLSGDGEPYAPTHHFIAVNLDGEEPLQLVRR